MEKYIFRKWMEIAFDFLTVNLEGELLFREKNFACIVHW